MSILDENALEAMSFVVQLTQHISSKLQHSGHVSQYMPNFLWVLRDFALDLEDEEGNPITSNQYLERCLTERPGYGSKNNVRQALKSFFVRRDCITLVRPTNTERDLKSIDSIPESSLRPEFLEGMDRLRKSVFDKIEPKTIMGKRIDGEGFLNLIQNYVDSVNSEVVPNIENTWDRVASQENARFQKLFLAKYKESMDAELEAKPMEEDVFLKIHEGHRHEALKSFLARAMGEPGKILDSLEEEILAHYQACKKENSAASFAYCSDLFEELYTTIIKNPLANAEFKETHNFLAAWSSLQDEWKEKSKGEARHLVFASQFGAKIKESITEFNLQVNTAHKNALEQEKAVVLGLKDDLLQEKHNSLTQQQEAAKDRMNLVEKYEDKLSSLRSEKALEEEKLRQQIEAHRREAATIQGNFEALQHEKEKAERDAKKKLKETKEEARRNLESIKEEAQRNLDSKGDNIKNLERNLEKLRQEKEEEVEDLNAKLNALREEKEREAQQYEARLEEKEATLHKERKEREEEEERLNAEIRAIKKEKEEDNNNWNEKFHTEVEANKKEKEESNSDWTQKYQQLREEKENQYNTLQGEKEDLERRHETLTEEKLQLEKLLQERSQEVQQLIVEKEERDQQIQQLTVEKEERDQQIQQFIVEKEERDQQIQQLIVEKEERDQQIQQFIVEKEERDQQIQQLIVEKEERDQKILRLSEEGSQEVQKLISEREDRDSQIKRLISEKEERDEHIERLSTEKEEKEREIEKLVGEKEEQARIINKREQQLSQLALEKSERESEIEQLKDTLTNTKNKCQKQIEALTQEHEERAARDASIYSVLSAELEALGKEHASLQHRTAEREEIDAKIADIIENIMKDNINTNTDDNAKNGKKGKAGHRSTLQKMVYTAIGGLSKKEFDTGPNPVAVLSDVLQQIFSEYDVLVIENKALRKFQDAHPDAEYVQWKLIEDRTWKPDSPSCLKCGVEFTFWSRAQRCKACAHSFCDKCCSNRVVIQGLAELSAPSAERKCDTCVEFYQDYVATSDKYKADKPISFAANKDKNWQKYLQQKKSEEQTFTPPVVRQDK
eukprot:TRINITY_DN1017_c0_g1_i2.p1 TRINITY_DN1017_c0_g1~~TRINITY_DN1017_c0_g1_i2.p1  ORF type:complete len:1074 (+),score=388.28 TRINITY_DN1017_c0_g1_i2:123-3344(+)